MRILFAGSPAIAVPCLEALYHEFDVVGVLTNPDRKRGRGMRMSSTEVKNKAQELGIPVIQYEHLYRQSREDVTALTPELLVSFAYGRIFGQKFLELFPLGGVNVHPSLLPKFRGCAPIQAAILSGEDHTGITVQRLALKMDAGDIMGQMRLDLTGEETTGTLTQRIAAVSPELLVETLRSLEHGENSFVSQDEEEATYCTFIEKSEAKIDWSASADEISRKTRAYYPWPKASTRYNGKVLMITYALPLQNDIPGIVADDSLIPGTVVGSSAKYGIVITTGQGLLGVTKLQLQSKKEMGWESFMNGNLGIVGSILGPTE